jgi:CysZ protein
MALENKSETTHRPRDNPVTGAFYLFDGLRLLGVPGLRVYVAIPLLINITLFGGGLYWAWGQLGRLSTQLQDRLPNWLDFLSLLLIPLFFVAALGFVFLFFSIIANFVAAPFNGLLAEAVERHLKELRGEQFPGEPLSLSSVLRDVVASISSELRKLAYFLPRALAIGVLYFIPGLNLFAPFLWLAFTAWMLAMSYADYPMANHRIPPRLQRAELKRWRLTSLSFGGTAMLGTLIPFANLVVMPAAVAGATKMWVDRIEPHRGIAR